jgi:hypothetical protein
MKIDVICLMDGDGHFHAVHIDNRKQVINAIKSVEDGNHYVNVIDDMDFDDTLSNFYENFTDQEFRDFVGNFIERGRCEQITIEI